MRKRDQLLKKSAEIWDEMPNNTKILIWSDSPLSNRKSQNEWAKYFDIGEF
jgi:hypothetical protein